MSRGSVSGLLRRLRRHVRGEANHPAARFSVPRVHLRLLRREPLEDRRMLSIGPYSELPDLPPADLQVDNLGGHVIHLHYDCEENVTHNGRVEIGPFDVPAFIPPAELTGQEAGNLLAQEDPENRVEYFIRASRIYEAQGNPEEARRFKLLAERGA